ncbi:unnamed protein product (macronuclear) [Paramecium tetraurelia]|uniref:PX domain-containing protein n=1 Tax=Paramecium tetraurelia TaxID=5888 RepID=A0C901_PARTE|nr:uncharacterized protein GSPATT00006574001 [Paramecium tetraurelia]CAK67268.1 unnamed protein product [Paramecium tetraurelia]|eukprot:XP_001434665.1 hypothetical protein (macronuclear) [Paramecium tetraurelia strain d4-2]
MQKSHNSVYQLKIVNTETRSDIVYYQIQVQYSINISGSHGVLKKDIKNLNNNFPHFQLKSFLENTDPEFISTRKAGLQNYFKTLLQIVDADQCPTLKKFLTKGEQKHIKDQQQQPFKEDSIKQNDNLGNASSIEKIQQQKQQENERIKKELKEKLASATQQIKSKFVDLGNLVNPPEESDIKKKRAIYDQIRLEPKNSQFNIDIPKPSQQSKMMIAQSTIEQTQPKLIQLISQLQAGVESIIGV